VLQSFVITLREGLESFLIVAIIFAYLRKSGRHELAKAVALGVVAAGAGERGRRRAPGEASNQALWKESWRWAPQ